MPPSQRCTYDFHRPRFEYLWQTSADRLRWEIREPQLYLGCRCTIYLGFPCNGVDGVFVFLQYFFEEVVVEALAARIEGWVDDEPLIDSHCVYLIE